MSRLFKRNIQAAAITAPDAAILWRDRPYIQYEQIRLLKIPSVFWSNLMSNKTFRTGMQNTPYQKSIQVHHHIK